MPIYEYRSVSGGCEYCRTRFEVRQGIKETPLKNCPKCGSPVRKLFSRPFICVTEPRSESERQVKHTEEEADRLNLTEGFAEDKIYE